MVTGGKARIFADTNQDEVTIRRTQEALFSLGSRKNDSSTGAVQFGGQSGFVPPAQSGLQDTSKVEINGSQMEGPLGFSLKLCELNVATNTLDIARNTAGFLFKDVANDAIVRLSAGVTANLEFIEFAKFPGHRLRLYGIIGNTITIIHTAIGTPNAIKCPTDVNFVWLDDEILDFTYNVISGQWHLMTGVGPSGGGGAFANQTLSNLTPNLVRVNTDLEPDTTATHLLGTLSLKWLDLFLSGVAFIGSFDSAGIGGAGGDFNANFFDIDAIGIPANPPAGTRRVFVDTTNSDALSVQTSGGSTVSLEAGAGAGFANQSLSNLTNPTSINEDLIPQANKDLGSTADPWDELHVGQIDFDTTGTKDATKHQIIRDSPNNNMVFNVPANEEYTWCEAGTPNMNLDFGRLGLVSLGAGVDRTSGAGPFDEFLNSTTPGVALSQLGRVNYAGFDSINQQTTFVETVADLISPIAGSEIGNYRILTMSRGIPGGLTYEQKDDTFEFANFGEASLTIFFDIVDDPVAVPPGFLDIVQRFRGQNSLGVLQDMVRFETLWVDRTSGSEDVAFTIEVQQGSSSQPYVTFNDAVFPGKIRSFKTINMDDNLLEFDSGATNWFDGSLSGNLDLFLASGLEYLFSSGAFFVGDAGASGAFMQVRDLTTPGTPIAGRGRIFLDSVDNVLKIIHDDTSVKSLEASGAGSQTPWLTNINADKNDLNDVATINLTDTGGIGDGKIVFDFAEDGDTFIGNDTVIDQVRFVANAVPQATFNAGGFNFFNTVSLGTNFMEIIGIAPGSVPTPPIAQRNLFVDNTTGTPIGQLSVKKSDGTVISLEGAGGGGGADTDLNNLVGTAVNQSLIPDNDNQRDLGSPSREWRNAFFDGAVQTDTLQVDASLTVLGPSIFSNIATFTGSSFSVNSTTINLGNSSSDNINMNGRVDTSIIPDNDNAFDLGSGTLRWRNIFADGIIDVNGDLNVSDDAFFGDDVQVGGELEIDGDFNHDGSRIGFFGRTPQTKNTVPFATFSLASVVIAFNTLRGALLDYGLIQ